jgi:hypothetical protein
VSLIQKPGVEDFRDSSTVRTVRGATIAVREGGLAVRRGIRKLVIGFMLCGFIFSGLTYIGKVNSLGSALRFFGVMGLAVGGLFWVFRTPTRSADTALEGGADNPLDGISVPLPEHLRAPKAEDGFHVDYWTRALTERAGWRFALGFLLVFASQGILLFLGMALVARGLLLIAPLLGSRVCVSADRRELVVHSLLGKKTVTCDKIEEVFLRTSGHRDLWVLFGSGSRHNLVVRGQHDFDIVELRIPYPLLGLDRPGAKRLAARIMDLRGQAVASPQAARQPPRRAPVPAVRDRGEQGLEGFDPDAIVGRYLAERQGTALAAQLPPVPRPATFGRKRVL